MGGRPYLAVLALLVTAPAAAQPETLTGPARVIDGDTFAIGTTVVRVADVDAPEMAQRCDDGSSALRHCGAYVADALKERIGNREVRCAVRELDQYDRRISTCEVAELACLRGPGAGQPPLLRQVRSGRGGRQGSGPRYLADLL